MPAYGMQAKVASNVPVQPAQFTPLSSEPVSVNDANIGLILVNRGFGTTLSDALARPNISLWFLAGAAGSILAVALFWGPARNLFAFGALNGWLLAASLGTGIAFIVLLEAAKARIRKSRVRTG